MNRIYYKNNKIKDALILAAGSGKRLGYLGNLLPKTLFPVYNKPILHHIINFLENCGVKNIYIVVNFQKEKIYEYIKTIKNFLNLNVHFIEQNKLDGTANAILLLEEYFKNNNFITMLGDEFFITNSFDNMLNFFYANDSIVTEAMVVENNVELIQQTCCAKLNKDGRIIEILEKPQEPKYNICGCGIYLFRPEIFEFIRETEIHPIRKEKEITLTINNVAKIGKAYGFMLDGYHVNINDSDELLKASILFKNKLEEKIYL